jgi:hypothetical protein
MTADPYLEFLRQKVNFDRSFGFDVAAADVHPVLKPHQRDIVRWAVAGGRRAIFAAFGLGKSVMQLEILRLIQAHEGGRQLILCPLGVRQEFAHDGREPLCPGAEPLGVETRFIRRSGEVAGDGIYITNYESIRDGRLDPGLFGAVTLDEASVLRSYGSKTYQTFLDLFQDTKYRFVATATPSPNRYKELIHYAGFLGVMDTGQALTRFFKRDSTQANHLTLYPHKVEEFWLWLNTWAIFLQSPADLGYDATGYDLLGNTITWHEISTPAGTYASADRDGQGRLVRSSSLGVADASREKRDTMAGRVAKMGKIIDGYQAQPGAEHDQVVIWCDLNAEQDAIEKALKSRGLTFSSIYGSLPTEEAERRLAEWRSRRTYALIGKPVMLGCGVNLQQCNKAIFVGVTFKFNDVIQASHRIHRYGQDRTCETHFIHAESEREVVTILQAKWDQHRELTEQMTEVIRAHGLNQMSINEALTRSMGVERIEATGEGWLVAHNDCVLETRGQMTVGDRLVPMPPESIIAPGSVDLIVTSIPFSNHYEYTPSYNDMGHTDGNDHFWEQMDFLTPELLNVLAPGRMYCCHVKDRILFGRVTGAGNPTVSPFHAEALMHGIRHGFDYMGMITVVTDVVRENKQSYRLGWSEQCKDGTKMGVGSPEYILLFRKPQTDRSRGYADTPVVKDKADYTRARWQVDAHAFWRSNGDRALTPEDMEGLTWPQRSRLFTEWTLKGVYDYEAHVRIGETIDAQGHLPATYMSLAPGSPDPAVWADVNRMLTLNTEQSRRAQVMHVCPLQFDIVDRLIRRYSNPGDLVYDPFGGLATVVVRALKLGRRGRSVELNPDYWADGVRYCQGIAASAGTPSLFDLIAVDSDGDGEPSEAA